MDALPKKRFSFHLSTLIGLSVMAGLAMALAWKEMELRAIRERVPKFLLQKSDKPGVYQSSASMAARTFDIILPQENSAWQVSVYTFHEVGFPGMNVLVPDGTNPRQSVAFEPQLSVPFTLGESRFDVQVFGVDRKLYIQAGLHLTDASKKYSTNAAFQDLEIPYLGTSYSTVGEYNSILDGQSHVDIISYC